MYVMKHSHFKYYIAYYWISHVALHVSIKLTYVFNVTVWSTTRTGHTAEWGNWTDEWQSNQSGSLLRLWQHYISEPRCVWRFQLTISPAFNNISWRGDQQPAWRGTVHHLHRRVTSFPATNYKAWGRHVLLPGGQWSRNYTQDFQTGCLGLVYIWNNEDFVSWKTDIFHYWDDHCMSVKMLKTQLRFPCTLSASVCWSKRLVGFIFALSNYIIFPEYHLWKYQTCPFLLWR